MLIWAEILLKGRNNILRKIYSSDNYIYHYICNYLLSFGRGWYEMRLP
jgi:hypothetical protein